MQGFAKFMAVVFYCKKCREIVSLTAGCGLIRLKALVKALCGALVIHIEDFCFGSDFRSV
jgi:hypothetical protein